MFIPSKSLFYIHIPKSGGTTISSIFGFNVHGNASHEKTLLRHKNLKQCFDYCKKNNIAKPNIIFTTIRNRFDILQSSYRWMIYKSPNHNTRSESDYSFLNYLQNIKIVLTEPSHEFEIRKNHFFYDKEGFFVADFRMIAPIEWWTDGHKDVLFVRTEKIEEDFNQKIAHLVGMEDVKINIKNANSIKPRPFKPEEVKAISEIYGEEIKRFGFKLPCIT